MNAVIDVDALHNASPTSLRSYNRWPLEFGVLLMVAVLTRGHLFSNPVAHIDDQFYLLVGRAMLDGELPYVDIWDRKPFGLFLLYSGIAALGGSGVIQTQIVAGLTAVLTAFVISRIGDRIAPFPGGLLAGVTYLVLMPMLSGGSGQSPVFYNLPMACAALLTFDAWREQTEDSFRRRGILAMFAVGLAMTLKPTVIFEGCFFGLLFLILQWLHKRSLPPVLLLAATLIFVAILPTALSFAFYWSIGNFSDLWQATVISVLDKSALPIRLAIGLFLMMAIKLVIPIACIIASLRLFARTDWRTETFLISWLAAAVIGVISIPNFFDHYALPFLVPASCAMALALARPLTGLVWAATLAAAGTAFANRMVDFDGRASAAQFERVAALVRGNLNGGCLYVFEGPVHLYTATNACRLTRFVFPDHLNSAIEALALPVVPEVEIARIFQARPAVVVDAKRIFLMENGNSRRILSEQLACNYRLVGTVKEFGARFKQPLYIWARRPGWRSCATL